MTALLMLADAVAGIATLAGLCAIVSLYDRSGSWASARTLRIGAHGYALWILTAIVVGWRWLVLLH